MGDRTIRRETVVSRVYLRTGIRQEGNTGWGHSRICDAEREPGVNQPIALSEPIPTAEK